MSYQCMISAQLVELILSLLGFFECIKRLKISQITICSLVASYHVLASKRILTESNQPNMFKSRAKHRIASPQVWTACALARPAIQNAEAFWRIRSWLCCPGIFVLINRLASSISQLSKQIHINPSLYSVRAGVKVQSINVRSQCSWEICERFCSSGSLQQQHSMIDL